MKATINALVTQLTNYADLSFSKDSGYASRDIAELIQLDRYPFFNVTYGSEDEVYEKVSDLSQDEIERHLLPIAIQYGVRAILKEVSVLGDDNNTGILDFSDFIWEAVKSDRTLGGVVSGLIRPLSMRISPVTILPEEPSVFKEGREMLVMFYRDQDA